jgi:diguanylate cyclase (GGDEF)-like protein
VARLGFLIDTASESRPVSIVTFDFDQFKQVNDQFGHAAGDHILKVTSSLVTSSFVRPGDVFARMGGEEFVIALPDTTLDAAVEVAERIRAMFEERTFEFEGAAIHLTSSFGVCCATTAVEHPETLLARADELLYRSKREGRNRVSAQSA